MKVIKGILIDTINTSVRVVVLGKSWSTYCSTIGSNNVELIVRQINNQNFAMLVEEYDKSKLNQVKSAISTDCEEMLYGNLLILGLDESDELVSLTDKDINLIFDNIHSYDTNTGLRQNLIYER